MSIPYLKKRNLSVNLMDGVYRCAMAQKKEEDLLTRQNATKLCTNGEHSTALLPPQEKKDAIKAGA